MLYIDQPVEAGFSLGKNTTSSTEGASLYVWKLIQAFYAAFPEYKSRDFGIFTESYGGHYGAHFAKYILAQNKTKTGAHRLYPQQWNIKKTTVNSNTFASQSCYDATKPSPISIVHLQS
jgi:carboxypeptidase C (cathepsin A)